MMISTLLFLAFPSLVSLSARGWVYPIPMISILPGSIPTDLWKNRATAAALALESSQFDGYIRRYFDRMGSLSV